VELGVPASKLFVAWNSIDTEEIERLIEPRPFAKRQRILCISRLIAEKKVNLLVNAFHKATAVLPPTIRLTIIGDGPERANLEKLVEMHSLGSRVEFVGSVYEQTKLAPYFNDSVVSVSPGYIGLSAIHSMAYGVPMLVADHEPHSPEVAAIEDKVNAQYFSANNVDELAKQLLDFVREPQTAEKMGQAAFRKIQEGFSVEAMVRSFEQAVAYVHRCD